MAPLPDLPNEIIWAITAKFNCLKDIAACILSFKQWRHAATYALHEFDGAHNRGFCITRALQNDDVDAIERVVALMGMSAFQFRHLTLAGTLGQNKLLNMILRSTFFNKQWKALANLRSETCDPTPTVAAATNGEIQLLRQLLHIDDFDYTLGHPHHLRPRSVTSWVSHLEAVALLLSHRVYREDSSFALLQPLESIGCSGRAVATILADAIINCAKSLNYFSGVFHPVTDLNIRHVLFSVVKAKLLATTTCLEAKESSENIRADTVCCLELVLSHSPKINHQKTFGYIALICAAAAGRSDLVAALLRHGADTTCSVNTGESRRTALLFAVDHGDIHLAKELLNQGADLEFALSDQYKVHPRPLELAAKVGDLAMAKFLLDAGANVNSVGIAGRTPVHVASYAGSADMIQLLLDYGADINSRSANGHSPLHVAKNAEVVRLILQHGVPVDVSKEPKRASVYLGGWRDSRIVPDGQTPLIRACEAGRGDVVQALLDAGADPMALGGLGHTTLNLAAYSGLIDAVRTFIKLGVPINQEADGGFTPLHTAITRGHPSIVQLLLEHGADVNMANWKGDSGLHLARGSTVLMELLLRHGADVHAKQADGLTLLHQATKLETNGPLQLEYLLSLGCDIEAKENKGYTPLHRAIKCSDPRTVRFLIERGANTNSRNREGWTPLMTACSRPLPAMMDLLIAHGADINATVSDAPDALSVFEIAVNRGNTSVLRSLLRAGIDPEAYPGVGTEKSRNTVATWMESHP